MPSPHENDHRVYCPPRPLSLLLLYGHKGGSMSYATTIVGTQLTT